MALVMVTTFSLELMTVGVQTVPFSVIGNIIFNISSPTGTSYFTDAAKLAQMENFLPSFHTLLPSLNLHSVNKPPGTLLFFFPFIQFFGYTPAAAFIAGLTIGILSLCAILACYYLLISTTEDGDAAFYGASFFALCPGLILFFPKFDQIHPILSCALLITWIKALGSNKFSFSIGFGLILSLICLISYSLLVLGIFLLLYSLRQLVLDPRTYMTRLVVHTGIGVGTFLITQLMFGLITGFDPVATFRTALDNQAQLETLFKRPYPLTIPFDLADFALGSGWISFLLAGYYVARARNSDATKPHHDLWTTVFGFTQFVGVAISGLLAVETARVWLFLVPLLLIPVGSELRYWGFCARMAAFSGLWFLTAVVAQNITFLI